MSRVIVKNLPKAGIDLFKKHAESIDEITDFNFKSKSSASNVGYAFVGFKCADSSDKIIQKYGDLNILNQKLELEIAADLFSTDRPKSLNKKRLEELRAAKKIENLKAYLDNSKSKEEYFAEKVKDLIQDEEFKTFLTFKSFNKKFSYKQRFDEMIEKSVKDAEERNKKFEAEKLKIIRENSSNSEDKKRKDCNEEQYFIKFKGPKTIKKYDVKNFFAPAKIKDIEIPWRGKRLNPSYIDVEFESKNDQVIGMAKNDRFLLKTKVHLIPYEKTPELEKNKDFSDQSLSNDTPVENGKLFFRNLPFTCSVQEVRDLFEKFGSLSDFSIKTYDAEDSRTLNRGFGSCTFVFNDDAIKALKSLDGSCFQGRIFHVLAGKQSDQNYDFVRDEEINPNNFKAIKDKKLKDSASKNIGNWNTFFFTPDTVANILESKFGIRKEELLNPTQKDLPVTIALAETKIIEETRTYLESHDIILDSFANNSSQRSDTIILIKNLPISYDYKDIKDTFYLTDDSIKRLVKAPSSSTCVVEFRDNRKSQYFMKKFAYYKIKSNVIYLEWAPITTFTKDKKRNLDETTDKTTIIVKNLPFQAQRDELHQLFSSFGNIESIRLPLKSFVSSKNPIQTHKGFAFVQFTSNLDAQKAFNSLSISTHLYGRRLVLEYASDDTQYDQNLLVESARKKTKMISDQYSHDFKKSLINDVIESREA